MKFRSLAALCVLMCCTLMGCKTIEPTNSALKDMQERATPEPLYRLSPAHEQPRAKAAMVQWVEEYLKHEYRVVDQRFVLTAPGDTNLASTGAKAHQYVTETLSGAVLTSGWFDDDRYRVLTWTFGDSSPRYLVFVLTRDFLPGTRERSLIGYFELVPSKKH